MIGWRILSLIVVMLSACHDRGDRQEAHRAEANEAEASKGWHFEDPSSPNGYQVEMDSYGENGRITTVVHVAPAYRLKAFGGELMGDDRGEFGGELMFRDQHGLVHRVLKENVHGIFQMPFGIVAFTGLAHLSLNSGKIYLVTASPGGVVAGLFRTLPGAPDQVVRDSSADLHFKVFTRRFEKNEAGEEGPAEDCYRMTNSGTIEKMSCASGQD
jgi:hypothetical protein